MSITSVDELCVALGDALNEHLDQTMRRMGCHYGSVKTMQQLPTASALSTASLPAIAITTPGLVQPPSRSAGTWAATWRLAVSVYDRGRDHDEVQARIRNWCAGIRIVGLDHKSLGGRATALTWIGEEYANLPDRQSARTIGAGAVAFDVTANVISPTTAGALPVVTSTPTTVSVK